MGSVIGGNAHLYLVALNYLDSMLFHSAGQDTSYCYIIITPYFHSPATKDLCYNTFQLDKIVSTQFISLLISTLIC